MSQPQSGINPASSIIVVGVFGCFNTISIVFMALSPKGVLKMNEVAPGVLKAPAKDENGSPEKSDVSSSAPPPPTTVYSFIANALELIWSPRGVGWKFGTGSGVYIHKDWRNLDSKSVFMRQTLVSIVKWFIALDVSNAIVEQAGIRVPGGTLFGRGRNTVESLLIAMLLTHATNFVILSGEQSEQLACVCFTSSAFSKSSVARIVADFIVSSTFSPRYRFQPDPTGLLAHCSHTTPRKGVADQGRGLGTTDRRTMGR